MSRNGYLEIDCCTYIQRVLLALGRKIDTDICLPLAGKYILKPCSGSKFSHCSKNRTLC